MHSELNINRRLEIGDYHARFNPPGESLPSPTQGLPDRSLRNWPVGLGSTGAGCAARLLILLPTRRNLQDGRQIRPWQSALEIMLVQLHRPEGLCLLPQEHHKDTRCRGE